MVTGMERMSDGSEMLQAGTYVRVDEKGPEARSYIAVIVGTDMFRSKYEVGHRYAGWSEWHFLDGGGWAFIGEVTVISEAEALARPEKVAE